MPFSLSGQYTVWSALVAGSLRQLSFSIDWDVVTLHIGIGWCGLFDGHRVGGRYFCFLIGHQALLADPRSRAARAQALHTRPGGILSACELAPAAPSDFPVGDPRLPLPGVIGGEPWPTDRATTTQRAVLRAGFSMQAGGLSFSRKRGEGRGSCSGGD